MPIFRRRQDRPDAPRTLEEIEPTSNFAQYLSDFKAILPALRPANPEDYSAWLRGYREAGGTPTRFHDYPMRKDDHDKWYVATEHLEIPPLCGAASVNIIVPAEIVALIGKGHSHNDVYYMDGYRTNRSVAVRVFSDTE